MFLLQQQQRQQQHYSEHNTQQLSSPISLCGCVFIRAAVWAGSMCFCCWGGDTCLCVLLSTFWHLQLLHEVNHYALCAAALVVIQAERLEGERNTCCCGISYLMWMERVCDTSAWSKLFINSWISHHAGKKGSKIRDVNPWRWTALSDFAKKNQKTLYFYICKIQSSCDINYLIPENVWRGDLGRFLISSSWVYG